MSFDRASAHFDGAAVVVDAIRERLLERLALINHEPEWVLDLGAATGRGVRGLGKRYPKARVLALDRSAKMLRRCRGPWYRRGRPLAVVGDATRLPLASASVDMVFANLTLSIADPAACVRETARVLAPGGLFAFASLGPESFRELRIAAAADGSPFLDMHIVGDALVGAGLGDPVLDVDRIDVTYPSLEALLLELRHLGVLPASSRPGLGGRRRLATIAANYPNTAPDGRLNVSLELVFGHAWAGSMRAANAQGEVRVPLRAIRSRE